MPGQGLGHHHYRLRSVRSCVELQSFAILRGKQGIWQQLPSGTEQDSLNIQEQHSSKAFIVFSLARRKAEIIAVVLLLSDMKLADERV